MQQALIGVTDQNNSNRNEKTKIELRRISLLILLINHNGGTFLFHSLNSKHINTQGLLSLNHHDSSNRNDGSNRTMAMPPSISSSSSSSSSSASSEAACISSSQCYCFML